MGHPLSQTLFTSLYVDRILWPEPKTLEQASFSCLKMLKTKDVQLQTILSAYCLAVIKTCDFVHRKINQESYYEVRLPVCVIGTFASVLIISVVKPDTHANRRKTL